MFSIWNLLMGGMYPQNSLYYLFGAIIFAVSFLVPMLTLPFAIRLVGSAFSSIWTSRYEIKKQVLSDADKEGNQTCYTLSRIILFFYLSVIFVGISTMVFAMNGAFILYTYYHNKNNLFYVELKDGQIINYYPPAASHYVLFIVQSVWEVARDNLSIWTLILFIYLAMGNKRFYFYPSLIVSIFRMAYVFLWHYNLIEYIMINQKINGNFEATRQLTNFLESDNPFHILLNSYTTLENIIKLVIIIPAMVITAMKAKKSQRPTNYHPVNFLHNWSFRLMIVLIIVVLIMFIFQIFESIVEAHYVSFAINYVHNKYEDNTNFDVSTYNICLSLIVGVAAIIPSFLYCILMFILWKLINKESEMVKITELIYDQQTSPLISIEGETKKQPIHHKVYLSYIILYSVIILPISIYLGGFTSHLFVKNGYAFTTLGKGDYLALNKSDSMLGDYITSTNCQSKEFSLDYQSYTKFEYNYFYNRDNSYEQSPDCAKSVLFSTDYEMQENATREFIKSKRYKSKFWVPENTTFSNCATSSNDKVNFTMVETPHPCFKDFVFPDSGLNFSCEEYTINAPKILQCNLTIPHVCRFNSSSMATPIPNHRVGFSCTQTYKALRPTPDSLIYNFSNLSSANSDSLKLIYYETPPSINDHDIIHNVCLFYIICYYAVWITILAFFIPCACLIIYLLSCLTCFYVIWK